MNADEILQKRLQAEQLLGANQADAADSAYRSILAIDPNDIHALMGRGTVARYIKDFPAAEAHYLAASSIHPRSTWPLFSLVQLFAMQQRWDEGEEIAHRAFALIANDYHTAVCLGRLRRDRGDEPGALSAFEMALAADPKAAGARLELGRSLIALKRSDEAEACYQQGLEHASPDQKVQLLRALATSAQRRGALDTAMAWWQQAAELAPGDDAIQSSLANAHLSAAKQAGDKNAVLVALENAHALMPSDGPTMMELATVYRDAGRLDEAEQLYQRALKIKPDFLAPALGLAMIARSRGQHGMALNHYQTAQAVHPKNSWVRIEIARSLRDLSRLDDADRSLQTVEATDQHYAAALVYRSEVARLRNDHRAALDLVLEAANASSDPQPLLVKAAGAALAAGDLTGARAIAADIASRDPTSAKGPMLDGQICRAVLDRDGAKAAFMMAAERAPHEAAPLIELATECLALGQATVADAHLDHALLLEPDSQQALLQRAERLRAQRDDAGAITMFERARLAHPTQPWAYLNQAQVMAAAGDIEDACHLLAQGRNNCGPTSGFAAREAGILQSAGYLDRAWSILEQGQQNFPRDMWIWTSRTSLAITLGYFEIAEQALADPPSITPVDQAHVYLARAKFAESQWRLEEACEHLTAALTLDPASATAAHELAKLSLFRFDLIAAKSYLVVQSRLQSASTGAAGRSPNITQSQLGQIYDEFAIQPRLAGTLAALGSQPAWSQIFGLLETARQNPDSTAAALALTIGLRRTGGFARAYQARNTASSIPRTICQYWDTPEPPTDVRAMIDGWIAAHPSYRHVLHDDKTAAAYLQKHAAPTVLQAFLRTRDRAQRADVFRLARLYAEGGIYIDADDRCRGSLDQLLISGKSFVAFQEDYGSIANNFIAVVPNHPIIKHALGLATEAITRGDRDIVWLSTGPGMFTRAFAATLANASTQLDDTLRAISIIDRHIVRKALVPYCQASYKRTNRHWQNTAFPSAAIVKAVAKPVPT